MSESHVIFTASVRDRGREILTPDAVQFLVELHREFDAHRQRLLELRGRRQTAINEGVPPEGIAETSESIRRGDWRVSEAPADLSDRRVEITGPVDRRMMINALNSGARAFMADLEDATSPTWDHCVQGQVNIVDAVRRDIRFEADGKKYTLNDRVATLLVRPRGWHLPEGHMLVDGSMISASLFDGGLFLFHNARELLERGSGPYVYLPKLEGHQEAALWHEVFCFAEDRLRLPRGSVRASVLIETIPAAFEMEEILWALGEHANALNAGRWDYLFSLIKRFHRFKEFVLPDRSQVTMTAPFMRAYTESLVRACHRRGAHAIGGMAAFVPSRTDPAVNELAFERVRDDKEREAGDGFDGTWVAHPDLVPEVKEVFDATLGERPHQLDRLREDVVVSASDLLDVRIPDGKVTEGGLRTNVDVGLRYLACWLMGLGAVAINGLMEDAATAEISRSQIWQWVHHAVALDGGRLVSPGLVRGLIEESADVLRADLPPAMVDAARDLFQHVALDEPFVEFMTLPAYERLLDSGADA